MDHASFKKLKSGVVNSEKISLTDDLCGSPDSAVGLVAIGGDMLVERSDGCFVETSEEGRTGNGEGAGSCAVCAEIAAAGRDDFQ